MKTSIVLAAAVLFGTGLAATSDPMGCYKVQGSVKFKDKSIYNSRGHCVGMCKGSNVYALLDDKCFCGEELPNDGDKTEDTKCNFSCPGYPPDSCGGKGNFYMFYDSGLVNTIPKAEKATSTSDTDSASTTSAKPSVVTLQGETVFATASAPPSESAKPAGPSKAGIAAGVVVGLLAMAGIAGGLFFYLRNRKRRALEEEHRRNAAVNSFVAGGKAPSSSNGDSFVDNRLDPVMAHRRMSDGSIADNQDYSRRILKVTNA